MQCPVGRLGSSTLWLAPPSQSRCPRGPGQVLVQGLSRGAPGPWLPCPSSQGAPVPMYLPQGFLSGSSQPGGLPGRFHHGAHGAPLPSRPQPQASTDADGVRVPGEGRQRGRHQRPLQPADRVGSLHCRLGAGAGAWATLLAGVARSSGEFGMGRVQGGRTGPCGGSQEAGTVQRVAGAVGEGLGP